MTRVQAFALLVLAKVAYSARSGNDEESLEATATFCDGKTCEACLGGNDAMQSEKDSALAFGIDPDAYFCIWIPDTEPDADAGRDEPGTCMESHVEVGIPVIGEKLDKSECANVESGKFLKLGDGTLKTQQEARAAAITARDVQRKSAKELAAKTSECGSAGDCDACYGLYLALRLQGSSQSNSTSFTKRDVLCVWIEEGGGVCQGIKESDAMPEPWSCDAED